MEPSALCDSECFSSYSFFLAALSLGVYYAEAGY